MTEEKDLTKQFLEFDGRLRRYFAMEMHKQGKTGSPHRGQGRVLTLLSMRDNISQKDLAFILGLRPQSVGELLGKLEKNQLILRTPSEDDKRVMLVSLTEEGQAEAKRISEEPSFATDLFDVFSDEEKNQFSALIEKLNSEISQRVGDDFDHHKDFMEHFGPKGPHGGGHPHHHGPGHHHHPHHHGGCSDRRRFEQGKNPSETGGDWTDF